MGDKTGMRSAVLFNLFLAFCPAVLGQRTILLSNCNGTDDTTQLSNIITAIGATNSGNLQLADENSTRCAVNTLTIPANVTLDNMKGIGIKVNTGHVLTVLGPVNAPLEKQLFFNAVEGSVVFSGLYPEKFSVMWWGAKGDGTTDDTLAFRAASAAMTAISPDGGDPALIRKGGTIFIPAASSFYRLTGRWEIYRPITVTGDGKSQFGHGSELVWTKASTGIYVHRYNTSGTYSATTADGTVIKNLLLRGTYSRSTGTANVTGGTLNVSRVAGPVYNSEVSPGYTVTINGWNYVIDKITSANSLSVLKPRIYVSVKNGSANLAIGDYASWPSGDWAGQPVRIAGTTYAISSNTSSALTLSSNFVGVTGTYTAEIQSINALSAVPTTINNFHGLDTKAPIQVSNVYVKHFSGNGINVHTSLVPSCCPSATDLNANNSKFEGIVSYDNRGSGFFTAGVNSNNLHITNLDATNNNGAGIWEASFLGNSYYTTHTSFNQFAATYMPPGALSNASQFFGTYSEGGQPSAVFRQYAVVWGGVHGAGFSDIEGSNLRLVSGGNILDTGGGMRYLTANQYPLMTPILGAQFGTNFATPPGGVMGFGSSDDSALPGFAYNQWALRYQKLAKGWWSWNYADNNDKNVIALSGSQAAEGSGMLWFPQGFYFGSGGGRQLLTGVSGTGPTIALSVSPTFTTPNLGTATASSLALGGGTPLTKVVVYSPSLTPASVAANTSTEQTFTVKGLTTADKLIINGPAPTAGTGVVNVRVAAPDTVGITWQNSTTRSLTPVSGTYDIIAVRN